MRYLLLSGILLLPFLSIGQTGSKKNIYRSFIVLNESLESSRAALKRTNERLYFQITKAYQESPEKFGDLFQFADSIRLETNELIKYLNKTKVLLISKSDDKEPSSIFQNDTIIGIEHLENFDDCVTPKSILIGELWHPHTGQYSAHELHEKIQVFIDLLSSHQLELGHDDVGIDFLDDSEWKRKAFNDTPLAGVLTFISKIQLDIKLAESKILELILTE